MARSGVIIPDLALPVEWAPHPSLKDAMSRAAASGRLYIDFTVTDAPNGNPRFYGSDAPFIATNVWGGPQVYPVVHSWGDLLKDLSGEQSGNATVTLVANALWTASNGTTARTVAEWIRQLQLRDVAASIYQWNEETTVQEVIWSGFIRQVDQAYTLNGVPMIDLLLSNTDRDAVVKPLVPLVTSAAYPAAPHSSIGKMPPVNYGAPLLRLHSVVERNSAALVGIPISGAPGILIDEQQTSLQLKVRFNTHDGTSSSHTFTEGATGDPTIPSDVWIYDQSNGVYGSVDNSSITATNDTSKLDVVIDAAPLTFFHFVPKKIGATCSSGFTTIMHKLTDSDRTNYVESSTTDYIWSFVAPEIMVNGELLGLWVTVDFLNAHPTLNRRISIGIWDGWHTGAAGYIGTPTTPADVGPGTDRRFHQDRSVEVNFNEHTGESTEGEFRSGQFITRDGSGNVAPMELRVQVDDIGGAHAGRDGVRVYHIAMVAEMRYGGLVPVEFRKAKRGIAENGGLGERQPSIRERLVVLEPAGIFRSGDSEIRDLPLFATGNFQKDDGSGTYTGSASSAIARPCDIANHLVHKHIGASRNVTAGTLGNFVDARDTINAGLSIIASYGPDETSRAAAIDDLNSRWPVRVFQDDSVYQCIPDDMNPHISRLYRSSSEQVYIEPQDVQAGTFRVTELSPEDFVNSVVLNYSHGYGGQEHAWSRTYDNKYSQMYFTKKTETVIDEPRLTHPDFSLALNDSADDIAEWYGRRSARPRLIASCVLTQKFYDLRRGHVVQFNGLERVSVEGSVAVMSCPAFRCGLIDYQFKSTTDTVNHGNSLTPTFIATGVENKITFMLQQQTNHLDFMVATAAVHTNVSNPWRYGTGLGGEANFANVVNPAAIKSTGAQRVSWDWPIPTAWKKEELTFGAFGVAGPAYPIYYHYTGGSVAGTGSARTHYDPVWAGRLFEVTKVSRQGTGENAYEGVYAEFLEVM